MKATAESVVCKAGREPLKNKTAVSPHAAAARWLQSFRSSTSGQMAEPKLKKYTRCTFLDYVPFYVLLIKNGGRVRENEPDIQWQV